MRVGCLAIALAALCLQSGTAWGAYTDAVVAAVDDKTITLFEVRREARFEDEKLTQRLTGEELDKARWDLWKRVTQDMVEDELLYAEFKRTAKERQYQVPRELILRRWDWTVQKQTGGDRERFESDLRRQGMRPDEFNAKLEQMVAVELLLEAKVRRRVHVSPAEVLEYYNAHLDEHRQSARLRLEAIWLKKGEGLDEKLQTVTSRLAKGEDFVAVGKEVSEYRPKARLGDGSVVVDLGWQQTADINAAFLKAIEGLKPSQTSKPFEAADGVFILRLAEAEAASAAPLQGELWDRIEKSLKEQAEAKLRRDYLDEISTWHHIEVYIE